MFIVYKGILLGRILTPVILRLKSYEKQFINVYKKLPPFNLDRPNILGVLTLDRAFNPKIPLIITSLCSITVSITFSASVFISPKYCLAFLSPLHRVMEFTP